MTLFWRLANAINALGAMTTVAAHPTVFWRPDDILLSLQLCSYAGFFFTASCCLAYRGRLTL